jgi:hypothetical protein
MRRVGTDAPASRVPGTSPSKVTTARVNGSQEQIEGTRGGYVGRGRERREHQHDREDAPSNHADHQVGHRFIRSERRRAGPTCATHARPGAGRGNPRCRLSR